MDIFNRPPDIAEDTLHYILYPQQSRNSKAAVASDATLIQAFVDTQLQDFLWHRDAFELKAVQDEDDSHSWTLRGTMRVGDSVDDEWCAVWLLKEISSRWDVAVSIWDSDGEFLLIEAAEALPLWVKPENSENRVWIYESRLHLIPLTHISPPSRKGRRRRYALTEDEANETIADDEEFLTTADALQLLRDPSIPTLAPEQVEKLVWNRIAHYPAALQNHVHRTNAYIPIDIARALLVKPALVQKAVETFYTRDATQLRAAHKMARFPPHDSVLTSVKMTRPAYAQLVGQKFFPPKIFGTSQARQDSDEWRWRDTGLKIAVGFEMLFQEGKAKTDAVRTFQDNLASEEARKNALRQTPEYQSYIASLVSTGYFRGEIEGSQLWKELESKASSTYINLQKPDDAARPTFGTLVNQALTQAPERPDSWPTGEDPDTWLNVDADNFEDMLQKTVNSTIPKAPTGEAMSAEDQEEEVTAAQEASKLADLAAKVEKFVEGEGDLDGARFDDEESSDGESVSETFSDGMPDSDDEDSDTQMTSVEDQARRREDMDKLVPGIEPSEYGQMPASFHENSQKVAPTNLFDGTDEANMPATEDKSKKLDDAPKMDKPIRKPIIPRDQYDGVDSDDETDEEADADSEDEEEQPQVVGDIEVDMGEEEEEFLEFSRQALGISDEQWQDILNVRKKRGAFVPKTATKPANASTAAPKADKPMPSTTTEPMQNPDLDSFEAVMQAMDAELARTNPKKAKTTPTPTSKDKGKGKATTISIESDESEDDYEAMTAELKASLGEDEDGELPIDYGLIKNFLESFKSQGGLSGPVSNLAGRLEPGWKLPRDHS